MADLIAKGQDFEKKAEKKINGWALFGSKYEDAAELFEKSANSFKLGKSWDRAGSVFMKLSNCHLKLDSKHEAANAYVNAAHCYKKTSTKGAISCLDQAVNIYTEIGRHNMAARYCKEIGELYELEQELENAILYFERAAEFFELGDATTSANQCKLKVAQFSAQLQQYQKAIDIFEDIARQSLNNNLLKYGVRGHLLNAGLCQLCRGDIVAITNSLERYQDLDPTFSRVREYKFLAVSCGIGCFCLEKNPPPPPSTQNKVVSYPNMIKLEATIQSVLAASLAVFSYPCEDLLFFYQSESFVTFQDLVSAIDEEDVGKFTGVVKEFDSMTPLDSWKTTLLLRVKDALKAKEMEEDDLT